MSSLTKLLAEHTAADQDDVAHLQGLVAEWQLLADLSFADLLLWAPTHDGDLVCVAQVRPTTGPTVYEDDLVGRREPISGPAPIAVALRERRIFREADPEWDGDLAVRREAVPVSHRDRVIAVTSRDTNLNSARSPSRLEIAYLRAADDLCQMIADGSFPAEGYDDVHDAPRTGDGLIRLDADGAVTFASPNALSAYRRLGRSADIHGERLAPLTRGLAADSLEGTDVADALCAVLTDTRTVQCEVDARGATVLIRALPLRIGDVPTGAIVLVRDVTDVRYRDRQLMSKDATIREINHRVKNNLQTVAGLLRMQARRVQTDEARSALRDSVRRVWAVAQVHETLALAVDERVPADEIVDRLVGMVAEVAGAERRVDLRRVGSFGELAAQLATPLAMVLTELMQNAVEHAFSDGGRGQVIVTAARSPDELRVTVRDDGQGLPPGFSLADTDRLGLRIVRTLVTSDLRGSIELRPVQPHGTEALLVVPLSP
ncbi:MAG: ATPase [Pseudonocardiales bacterium]|nr:MAG: ATPase [Pseudonocardiales bacterium]